MSQLTRERSLFYLISDGLPMAILFCAVLLLALKLPASADEINSLVIYASSWQSILLQDYPNNHTLTTALGYFLNTLFGVNLYLARLISVAALFTMIGLMFRYCEKKVSLLFLIALLLNPYCLAYACVFRGYMLQALLVFVAFLYYYKKRDSLCFAHYLTLDLLFCLNTIHMMSSLYVWIPFKAALMLTHRDYKPFRAQLRSGSIAGILLTVVLLAKVLITGYVEGIPHLSPPTAQHFLSTLHHEWSTVLQVGINTVFFNIFVAKQAQFFLSDHLKPILGLLSVNILLLPMIWLKQKNTLTQFCFVFVIGCILVYFLFNKALPDRNWIMYVPALSFIIAIHLPIGLQLISAQGSNLFRKELLQLSCLMLLIINPSYHSLFYNDDEQFFQVNRRNISDLIMQEPALITLFQENNSVLCEKPAYLDKNLRLLYLYEYQYLCGIKLSLSQVHQIYKDEDMLQKSAIISSRTFPIRLPEGYQIMSAHPPYKLYIRKHSGGIET